uniref:Uncharacterized protein n=1 Tax=Triticum urartu TaxID=4572 RepID=A0A8R7QD67_TRIUA
MHSQQPPSQHRRRTHRHASTAGRTHNTHINTPAPLIVVHAVCLVTAFAILSQPISHAASLVAAAINCLLLACSIAIADHHSSAHNSCLVNSAAATRPCSTVERPSLHRRVG